MGLVKCLLPELEAESCKAQKCTYCVAVCTGITTKKEDTDLLKLAKAALHRWGPKEHHRWCTFFKDGNSCDCGYAGYIAIMKGLFESV